MLAIRRLAKLKDRSYMTYKSYFEGAGGGAEVFCNAMISLIHQTNYLLDRQIKSLEQSFTQKGGLRERMHRARTQERESASDMKQALALLRGLYRDIQSTALNDAEKGSLLAKIQSVANLLKDSGNVNRK